MTELVLVCECVCFYVCVCWKDNHVNWISGRQRTKARSSHVTLPPLCLHLLLCIQTLTQSLHLLSQLQFAHPVSLLHFNK